jgi:hypothetical protein
MFDYIVFRSKEYGIIKIYFENAHSNLYDYLKKDETIYNGIINYNNKKGIIHKSIPELNDDLINKINNKQINKISIYNNDFNNKVKYYWDNFMFKFDLILI